MQTHTIVTFVAATAAVAIATWFVVRRMSRNADATVEYFTGGRALAWPVVAGSLLLTNLSTEQLVGLNGAVFKDGNLVGIAWEALAAFAMIATALLFLPRYLRSGFTTTPAFLEQRFDRTTRLVVSALFLFGYVTVLLPVVLYTGSLAIKTMFQLDVPLDAVVWGIGLLGSAYAIFGGLKAVAVSDTFNGIGLLIGGLAVPFLALGALGDGSVADGLATLYRESPESLTPLTMTDKRGEPASVPWTTLLTGMMFIQIFYWSTNQVIVQRAMGARSLAEGQKGVLFASLMKLVGPLMLCLPGIAAMHMMDALEVTIPVEALLATLTDPAAMREAAPDVPDLIRSIIDAGGVTTLATAERLTDVGLAVNDQVYPAMVRHVLPAWSLGLFAAVLVGSILSSFNSALNSASTLFCLEFYEKRAAAKIADPDARAKHVVKVGQIFGTVLAIASMLLAPRLADLESIFAYLQQVNGLYSVPIITIFLVGVTTERIPAVGAKAAMAVGLLSYGFFTFFGAAVVPDLHWLHGYAISFGAGLLVMFVAGALQPLDDATVEANRARDASPVDMTPWRHAGTASMIIVALTVVMYVTLSALAG